MDIAEIKSAERVIEIHHPGNEEKLLGIKVTLVSIQDEKMKKLKRDILNRRLTLESKGKHFKADEVEDNRNEIAFTGMTGWNWSTAPVKDEHGNEISPPPTFKGRVPDFSRREVFEVFKELPWFRDQIDAAMGETADFFAA